jgi:hypothetical protein
MATKKQILDRMALYQVPGGGIGSWLTDTTCDDVFHRLGAIDGNPLSAVQLNQLLVLAHEAPVSDGFFKFYWLVPPTRHPYRIDGSLVYKTTWGSAGVIDSLDHLAWGLHRLYADGLMYFGNVRTGFRAFREYSFLELQEFFSARRIDTDAINRRGPPLPLKTINKEQRHLISETACKNYGENPVMTSALHSKLIEGYAAYVATNSGSSTIRQLLTSLLPSEDQKPQLEGLLLSAAEFLDEPVSSPADIEAYYQAMVSAFVKVRNAALANTDYYLSMLTDLDVYVATSMRSRDHFLSMAANCQAIFSDPRLTRMNLRFFDPTLSAADGHEDKGLIECLMVKCAKALVYCRGEKESYGKDAEAAMALSLGKPVIFYCEQQSQFYKDVHPLSRLIHFETGVAVGAMIADSLDQVTELLYRTFENKMVYRLDRSRSGSLRLLDTLTGSVVRLQTSNELLSETFWNHYHLEPRNGEPAPKATAVEPKLRVVSSDKVPQKSREQEQLPLEVLAIPRGIAARGARIERPRDSALEGKAPDAAIATSSNEPLQLSREEVFDAVAAVKRNQVTGAKRCAEFVNWLSHENVNVSEGVKLLRFIETTLKTNAYRSNYVYTHSDLTRWYREMSAGDMVGTKR